MNTKLNTYKNTARGEIVSFVESLHPTLAEAPYVASIFAKKHVSMRDFRVLLEFTARRASKTPLSAHQIAALGLPSLPQEAPSQANTAAPEAIGA